MPISGYGEFQLDIRSEPELAPGAIVWTSSNAVDSSEFTISAADINETTRQMMAEQSVAQQVALYRAMEEQAYVNAGISSSQLGSVSSSMSPGLFFVGGDNRAYDRDGVVVSRVVYSEPQFTQEQIEEYQRRLAEEYKRSEEAAKCGMALLKSWLSKEQLEQYERNQYFDVTGSEGTRYRITNGTAGNVHQLDKRGKQVQSYCFQPSGSLCMGDTMLAQKIALETDEKAAIKIANKVGHVYYSDGAIGMTIEPEPLRRGSRFLGWLGVY